MSEHQQTYIANACIILYSCRHSFAFTKFNILLLSLIWMQFYQACFSCPVFFWLHCIALYREARILGFLQVRFNFLPKKSHVKTTSRFLKWCLSVWIFLYLFTFLHFKTKSSNRLFDFRYVLRVMKKSSSSSTCDNDNIEMGIAFQFAASM